MNINIENFEEIKTKGEILYKTIVEVHCSYFKEAVSFNAQGIEHLRYKQRNKARYDKDQYMRFKLIHLAPEVLKVSSSVQGILKTKSFVHSKINSRWEHILRPTTYYEFIAVIGKHRVKVIIKQIEDGKKIFWSIIPFWGMNTQTMTRILHDGNPEED